MALRLVPSQIGRTLYAASQAPPALRVLSVISQQCIQTLGQPIAITIPRTISEIWESVLRAVPKKKTSYSKKRSRQLAGKALKDVTALNTCSGCGRVKRAHTLCVYCVFDVRKLWKHDLAEGKRMGQEPSAQETPVKDEPAPLSTEGDASAKDSPALRPTDGDASTQDSSPQNIPATENDAQAPANRPPAGV